MPTRKRKSLADSKTTKRQRSSRSSSRRSTPGRPRRSTRRTQREPVPEPVETNEEEELNPRLLEEEEEEAEEELNPRLLEDEEEEANSDPYMGEEPVDKGYTEVIENDDGVQKSSMGSALRCVSLYVSRFRNVSLPSLSVYQSRCGLKELMFPIARLQFASDVGKMKGLKNEINLGLNGTDVSGCVQLMDMPFPKKGCTARIFLFFFAIPEAHTLLHAHRDSGYSELCETFCANVSTLSTERKAALDSSHLYHPAAFAFLKLYEMIGGIEKEPTPTCYGHFQTVDESDYTADLSSAVGTLAMILGFLNFAASDDNKGLKMLSIIGSGAVAACLGAFFYVSNDLIEATSRMSWYMVPPLMLGYLGFASKILDV
eukprot:jgi/Bigna1/90979/estExt_fgenesh1_pg.C_850004